MSSAVYFFVLVSDQTPGHVGPPIPSCDVMLVDWVPEDRGKGKSQVYTRFEMSKKMCGIFIGGYRTNDKPYPRGEILIGGPCVAKEYWRNYEKTNEDFVFMLGKRWFRTGDIGAFVEDGCLKIIGKFFYVIFLA